YCFRKFLELVFICSLFRHLQAVVCLAWCAIPGHEGRQRLSKIHLSCCQSSLCTTHTHTHTHTDTHTDTRKHTQTLRHTLIHTHTHRHTHTHTDTQTHTYTHTHTHTRTHIHTHTHKHTQTLRRLAVHWIRN